jgi:hypothetical protein
VLIFNSEGTSTTLIVNWEGSSHLELIVGQSSAPPRFFKNEVGQEIGLWDDPQPWAATVVEAERLLAIFSEDGPSQALPLVRGGESQLVVEYDLDQDRLELWILELYPPSLSPSVRLRASLFRRALFPQRTE